MSLFNITIQRENYMNSTIQNVLLSSTALLSWFDTNVKLTAEELVLIMEANLQGKWTNNSLCLKILFTFCFASLGWR